MPSILLSTDIGSDVDDALALLTMLNNPAVPLKAIVTVNGDVKSRAFIAKRMVELSRRKEIEVSTGDQNPLEATVRPYYFFEDALVENKFLDTKKMELENSRDLLFKSLEKVGIESSGVESLVRWLSKGKCSIFSIAPLTSVARLIKEHSSVLGNVESLYIMGFRSDGHMEHNVRFDTEAARIVMESSLPIIVVPADLCSRYHLPVEEFPIKRGRLNENVWLMLRAFIGAKLVQECRNRRVDLEFLRSEILLKIQALSGNEKYRYLDIFLTNFDEYSAYFEKETFLSHFEELLKLLEEYGDRVPLARIFCKELEKCKPQKVAVHDVYVPYCYLFPDKIQVSRKHIEIDSAGRCEMKDGGRFKVVTDLDFDHFKQYLRDFLK